MVKYRSTQCYCFLIGVAFVFLTSMCPAQDSGNSFLEDFDKTAKADTTKESSLKGKLKKELLLEEKKTELEIMKTEYLMKSLTHRDRVFFWQHTASIIIFIVVLIIVLSGLFLSYLHFYKDLKSQNQIAVVGTEIELNFKGLKITSSLIGLLILVLSIAFLYLYLVYVFPINEMSVDNNVTK